MSKVEIPQELVREMKTWVDDNANDSSYDGAGLRSIKRKLDALEQPPDPAEVAVATWAECNSVDCDGYSGPTERQHRVYHTRQAYAEREKAVKALSDHALDCTWKCCQDLRRRNARVRKLFRFDKENE